MGYNEIEADCQYLHFVQRRKRVGVWREFYRHTKNTCATDFGHKSLVKWHNTSFKRRRRRRRRKKKKERKREEKFTHHRTLRGVFRDKIFVRFSVCINLQYSSEHNAFSTICLGNHIWPSERVESSCQGALHLQWTQRRVNRTEIALNILVTQSYIFTECATFRTTAVW